MSRSPAKLATIPKRRTGADYLFLRLPKTIFEWPVSAAAFRLYCVVFNASYGWKKRTDKIALTVLMSKCRASKVTVLDATRELEECGLLKVTRKPRALNEYEPLFLRYVKGTETKPLNPNQGYRK